MATINNDFDPADRPTNDQISKKNWNTPRQQVDISYRLTACHSVTASFAQLSH